MLHEQRIATPAYALCSPSQIHVFHPSVNEKPLSLAILLPNRVHGEARGRGSITQDLALEELDHLLLVGLLGGLGAEGDIGANLAIGLLGTTDHEALALVAAKDVVLVVALLAVRHSDLSSALDAARQGLVTVNV